MTYVLNPHDKLPACFTIRIVQRIRALFKEKDHPAVLPLFRTGKELIGQAGLSALACSNVVGTILLNEWLNFVENFTFQPKWKF